MFFYWKPEYAESAFQHKCALNERSDMAVITRSKVSVLMLLMGLVFGSCSTSPKDLVGGLSSKLTPLNPPVTVKVAEDGAVSGAAFFLAHARGYFEALGIQIEWVKFPGSVEMLPALAADHVQVAGGITSLSLFNAFTRGIAIKIIGDKGHNRPGASYFDLVIRADLVNEIQDIADLKNRTILMFSLLSADEMMADEFVRAGGLIPHQDVKFLGGFGAAEMLLALSNKSADAAMLIEPTISQGVKEGILLRWKDLCEVIGPTENAVVLASPGFIQNIDLAGRFMVAYIKGARDYNEIFREGDRGEIAKILSQYTELKDLDTWNMVHLPGLNPDGYALSRELAEDLVWYRETGYFEGEIDLDEIIDHSAVEFALQYLGRYESLQKN